MTYFMRNGSSFNVTDEANVDIHTKLPVGNYTVKLDQYGNFFLERISSFTNPSKIYGDSMRNSTRILNTFMNRSSSTGVMLAGEKGSGKTLLAKLLSTESAAQDIPTIVINHPYHGDKFNKLIQQIEQPCVILFDEFEKVYDHQEQESILTLLDGVFPSKKLFVLTCNDKWRIDKHMRNRPGRIFYMLDFKGLDVNFIREYCEDNLDSKEHINQICQISGLFPEFNFDMLKALVEEMNRYNESPQEAMRMLNAKPEFSENKKYNVDLVQGGEKIRVSDSVWAGNPLQNDIHVSWYEKDIEADDDEYHTLEFSVRDLVKVDADTGSFTFRNNAAMLTLTRVPERDYDYWKAF